MFSDLTEQCFSEWDLGTAPSEESERLMSSAGFYNPWQTCLISCSRGLHANEHYGHQTQLRTCKQSSPFSLLTTFVLFRGPLLLDKTRGQILIGLSRPGSLLSPH